MSLLLLFAAEASGQEATARRPTIRVTMAPGHAKLVVRRDWFNPESDGFLVEGFSIPKEAVLTGLRVKRSSGGWQRTRLLPVDDARSLFDGKGSVGGEAVLLERSHSPATFTLSLFPFRASTTRTVEYTVLVPTEYENGRHVLLNPGAASVGEVLNPQVTRFDAPSGKRFIDGVDLRKARGKDESITGEELQLESNDTQLHGALAFFAFGKKDGARRALRYRIHTPAKLSRAPTKAQVVLVLDNSRSVSETQAAGMVAAARAYLSHLSDAKVDIITFDRHPHSHFGKLTTAAHAEGVLKTLTLTRRNGSDVKAALALAAQRLAGAPKGATKRVLLFTDTLTKASLDPADLGLDQAGGLLHVVTMEGTSHELERQDLHAWAPAVEKSGGVVWAALPRPAADVKELAQGYEELVRPVRIHRTKLRIPAAPALESGVHSTLAEGSGLSGLALAEDVDPRVELTGVLWSKPVSLTLHPSIRETKLWEGLLLGSDLADDLTEDEVRQLALKAKVVTDQTSLVTATAGKRQLLRGIGLGGIGVSSCCIGCRMGPAFGRPPSFAKPQQWLEKSLAAAYARCHGADRTVTVSLEATRDEVVDTHAETGQPELKKCMEDAAWDLTLPAGFGAAEPRSKFVVELP